MSQNDNISPDEIRKEFQVERMILFSDAVFAIVITLMAIEIRLPESEGSFDENLTHNLLHLLPVILAYVVSFLFIGSIWYQHLQTFSLVKDYDKGLVIRNLVLLFFVGLFPFCASLISHAKGNMLAFYIYMIMIQVCMLANIVLQHYLLFTRPALRVKSIDPNFYKRLHKNKSAVTSMLVITVLILITTFFIQKPELKGMAILWMSVFPLFLKVLMKVFKSGEPTSEQ